MALWSAGRVATTVETQVVTLGDLSAARAVLRAGLGIAAELHDHHRASKLLGSLAWVAILTGDLMSARAHYTEELALHRQLADSSGIAFALNGLGWVALLSGDCITARSLLEQSLALRRQLGEQRHVASTLGNLGRVACIEGDYQQATALYEAAVAGYRNAQDGLSAAHVEVLLGFNLLYGGRTADATHHFSAALAEYARGEPGLGMAAGLIGLSSATTAVQPERAVRLLGAARRILDKHEHLGLHQPPAPGQISFDRALAASRPQIDEETFARAWLEGLALTAKQAVVYALQDVQLPPDKRQGEFKPTPVISEMSGAVR
jgi:tetratricopeptide (TPR) repeat protein